MIKNEQIDIDSTGEYNISKIREKIEPWLTAAFQSEHLSLLIGTGLTMALTGDGGVSNRIDFNLDNTLKEKRFFDVYSG